MANTAKSPISLTSRQLQQTVDKLGAKRQELSALKDEVKFLEELLEDAVGPGRYVGKQYEANVLWITSSVFDQGKAKSLLTAGQLASCVKTNEFWRVNVRDLS